MKQITELIEAADSFFNKCHCVDDETASRLDRAIREAREWAKGKEPIVNERFPATPHCKICDEYISHRANFCSNCGTPIARPK
jgi:hypothetical protein